MNIDAANLQLTVDFIAPRRCANRVGYDNENEIAADTSSTKLSFSPTFPPKRQATSVKYCDSPVSPAAVAEPSNQMESLWSCLPG